MSCFLLVQGLTHGGMYSIHCISFLGPQKLFWTEPFFPTTHDALHKQEMYNIYFIGALQSA